MGLSINDYMPLYVRQVLHAVVDSPHTLFKKEVMLLVAVNPKNENNINLNCLITSLFH